MKFLLLFPFSDDVITKPEITKKMSTAKKPLGRIVLYELTRHSDHHKISSKKYQNLESYDEAPQLPYGYPTSILIALLPWVWFMLINPRIPKEMVEIYSKN